MSHDPYFVNIRLCKKWSFAQIDKTGFQKKLDINNNLYYHLSAAYSDDMSMKGMLVSNHLDYYDYISYDVLDGEKAKKRVMLQVGDVIDMEEEEEEEEEEAFAIIQAIFCHMANNAN